MSDIPAPVNGAGWTRMTHKALPGQYPEVHESALPAWAVEGWEKAEATPVAPATNPPAVPPSGASANPPSGGQTQKVGA